MSSLSGQPRRNYLKACKNISCATTAQQYRDLLLRNLDSLYTIVANKLQSEYHKASDSHVKNTIANLYNVDFNFIRKSEIKEKMNLAIYNVKSLQCVIILDYLCNIIHPNRKSKYVNKEEVGKIVRYVIKYPTRFNNTAHFFNDIQTQDSLEDLRDLIEYKTFPLPKYARMLVALGELSTSEIVESLLDKLLYIGITTDLEWADGEELTPLEFVYHDLVHATNIEDFEESIGEPGPKAKEFFQALESNRDKMKSEDYDKLMTVFFIILHETKFMYLLNQPIQSSSLMKELFYNTIDIKPWKDIHFYGALLPTSVRTLNDEALTNYLLDMFNFFRDTWNKYLETNSLSFLVTSDPVVPSVGSNSVFFMGNQEGGRRKYKKTRKQKKTRRQ